MKEEIQKRITEFLDDNKEFVVFVADPETDIIGMGYKDKLIANKIVNEKGEMENMIKTALDYKDGEKARGQLLLMISTMIYNIARDLADTGILKKVVQKRKKEVKT